MPVADRFKGCLAAYAAVSAIEVVVAYPGFLIGQQFINGLIPVPLHGGFFDQADSPLCQTIGLRRVELGLAVLYVVGQTERSERMGGNYAQSWPVAGIGKLPPIVRQHLRDRKR